MTVIRNKKMIFGVVLDDCMMKYNWILTFFSKNYFLVSNNRHPVDRINVYWMTVIGNDFWNLAIPHHVTFEDVCPRKFFCGICEEKMPNAQPHHPKPRKICFFLNNVVNFIFH